ncbi:NAD(P)/FAD-dependent oxidoreductase [Thiomicrospira microaerophila]|uniref:NAD(P)/FAD-dependent oxidoreductase n=1 Tax=Thiomicrospira microaerophila TaxID=406020 RepID=UPI00200F1588|nr:NAD(P)/FAD-dependent oxidoreductase [Thiomicrospira microaerophila]UQB43529.1 NAD(P)/FAD-dependent oxidoreductase [Thiomicrospira microaerophila]
MHYDVIILGAGAAGLMCAAQAGYRGRKVLVLDHAPKAAAKIRISGGGKCNFTNLNVKPENYICANPHFVKSALARYPALQFIELVERHGIDYEQRAHGQLFTLDGAGKIIAMLRTEADWAGVELRLGCSITQVQANAQGFGLVTSQGTFSCHSLVVATGGLAYPKLKASDFGMQLAQQFGLNVITSQPGLVPLVFKYPWKDWFAELAGLSLEVEICCQGQCFREAMLVTHQGISGPVVLQISNYWQPGLPISINLFPGVEVLAQLQQFKANNQTLSKWFGQYWTKRFTQAWLQKYPFENLLANASDKALEDYAERLTNWTLYPETSAGYDKAEVSLGGVDTDEVSSKTFEAYKQPGLYFIGEVLEVTGHLGGYNFQWAWASGHACGQVV